MWRSQKYIFLRLTHNIQILNPLPAPGVLNETTSKSPNDLIFFREYEK